MNHTAEQAAIYAQRITELERVVREINDTIYARGAPLGSSTYFLVRKLCCDMLYPQQKSAL